MFTGIVEEKGRVAAFTKVSLSWQLQVETNVVRNDAALGDSISVNGCCLTIAGISANTLTFDVLEETRRLTNFSALRPEATVNLERSLRFNGKIGGHFVTGHIDGMGTVDLFEQRGSDYYLRVLCPLESDRYIVSKGSISLDGVSLTIADVAPGQFAVWLIPTTIEMSNLGEKSVGDSLNLEFDMIGKYVEKLTRSPRN